MTFKLTVTQSRLWVALDIDSNKSAGFQGASYASSCSSPNRSEGGFGDLFASSNGNGYFTACGDYGGGLQ
jgi:hypothetical protein